MKKPKILWKGTTEEAINLGKITQEEIDRWDCDNDLERKYLEGKADEQERILKIIDRMRKDLNNPDYSYSNEWIENFLEELKAKIEGEKQ